MPLTLWIGHLAETFHCTPMVAYEEALRAPVGLLEDVMEALAFRSVYRAVKDAPDQTRRAGITQGSALGALAGEIEFELVNKKRGR